MLCARAARLPSGSLNGSFSPLSVNAATTDEVGPSGVAFDRRYVAGSERLVLMISSSR
jgi:hypothetical protein